MDRATRISMAGIAAAATSGVLSKLQDCTFALLYLRARPFALQDSVLELQHSKSKISSFSIRGLVDWQPTQEVHG